MLKGNNNIFILIIINLCYIKLIAKNIIIV